MAVTRQEIERAIDAHDKLLWQLRDTMVARIQRPDIDEDLKYIGTTIEELIRMQSDFARAMRAFVHG